MTPAIRAAIGALSENDLAILQRDLNGKAQQDRMMPTDHDKLRAAIARIKARAAACPVPVPVWAEDEFLVACAAASTLPKTKMVEVWRIWHSAHGLPRCFTADSEGHRDEWMRVNGATPKIACIRVTGPHQQEVPA